MLPAAAAARTKVVYAGGPVSFQNSLGQKYGGGVNNFLIHKVTVNAGDTVEWNGKALANGFHTVDIPAKGGSELPLITDLGTKVSSSVTDAAGNPFWFDGTLDNLSFNPALFGPSGGNTYDGTARLDSGLPLGKPTDFKVEFTKPGVYKYFCDVHYGMAGVVVVRAKGTPVPSAKRDRNVLKAEEHLAVAEARALDHTHVKQTKHNAQVSLGASGPGGVEVFRMFPATLHVKAGTVVTFFMSKKTRETHTATFGPAAYLNDLANSFVGPTGGVDPIDAYPSSPPGSITLDPTSHGNGFANVGALDRDSGTPAVLPSGKIDFTTPGTYHFVCLIHPFMKGTVVVGH